jgi:hypothetical protein
MLGDYLRQMFGGPGHLRFFIQPAIALILGVRDGFIDARLGRQPFVWALIHEPGQRRHRLLETARTLALTLLIAFAGSLLFQYLIRERISLTAAILYDVIFVALPYMLARALANRLSRARRRGTSPARTGPRRPQT